MPARFYPLLETARLRMEATDVHHASFILELLNTPKWLHYIGDRGVYDVAAAEAYIRQRMRPQYDRLGFTNYTLARQSDGELIGCCGLYERQGLEIVDLGFALLPQHEGQGYAREAAARLLELAFGPLQMPQVAAITSEMNEASQGLLKRLGFVFDRIRFLPNDPEPVRYYLVSPAQFRQAAADG